MRRIFTFLLICLYVHFGFGNTVQGPINSDTVWTGTISVLGDVVVDGNHTLTISAGSTILLKKGANILIAGGSTIIVNGTAGNEVHFKSELGGNNWGAIKARGPAAKILIDYADIQNGQVAAYDTAEVYITNSYLHDYIYGPRAVIYTYKADTAYVAGCHISNYYEANFVFTPALVENCLFEYMIGDGIDFDNSPPGTIIRRSTLRHGNGFNIDAVDWGVRDYEAAGSNGTVDRCLIYDISDKGVSIGEKCQHVVVSGCLIYNANAGVSVKDSSIAEILNNTIYNCVIGIESRQEREGMGGGHFTASDDIIWNCTEPIVINDGGSGQINYTILNSIGVYPGISNINSDPLFTDASNFNFYPAPGSPAIASGSASNDLGAIFPNGCTIDVDSTFLGLGSPSRNSVFAGDSIHPISWTSGSLINYVNLYFSNDNGLNWALLEDSVLASTQKYQWHIPNIYSTQCLIKVSSTNDPALKDSSYSAFSIIPKHDSLNVVAEVVFSDTGGFYNNPVNLRLSAEPGAIIYYTLDGSEPTDRSFVYTAPLTIEADTIHAGYPEQDIISTTAPQYPLSYIRTSPYYQTGPVNAYWVTPTIDLFKSTVVRAKCFVPGKGVSKTITNTYFVDDNMTNRFTMPVVSISLNKEQFFDYYDGVYIPGVDFLGSAFTGNYERRGRDFEKVAHVEMYEPDGTQGFSQNVGVRIKGEWIRSACYKSLELYCRAEYDEQNNFDYDVFKGATRTGSSIPLRRFKRLILRNAGNNTVWPFASAMFRDDFAQETIEHLNIKTQNTRPAIVFINGEYWGIQTIREDNDSRSIENHFGLSSDSIVIVEHNLDGRNQLAEGAKGDEQEYKDLVNFVSNNDMTLDANYNYFLSKVDSVSFCDHWVATIFTGKNNFDHNTTMWRYKGVPTNTYGGDGKWRWTVNDFDEAYYSDWFDTEWAARDAGPDYLYSAVRPNYRFSRYFLNRMADQLNSAFKPSYLSSQFEKMYNTFLPEMDEHIGRWSSPLSQYTWDTTLQISRNFIQTRKSLIYYFLYNSYGADSMHLQLNVSDPAHGFITVNSLDINEWTKGLADSTMPYPWTGIYFKNIPFKLKATALPGYRFVRWNETGDTSASLSVIVASDVSYTAVFELDTAYKVNKGIVINELMPENNITIKDNKNERADWIEVYNDKDEEVDLAGYVFSDGTKVHTVQGGTDSTKIPAKGFKLFWADDQTSQGVLHLNMKMSKKSDNIMLFAPNRNTLLDSISFAMNVADVSLARSRDGELPWIITYRTTPGYTNNPVRTYDPQNLMTLYPVPADNELNLIVDVDNEDLTIQLTDMLGRQIGSKELFYKKEDVINMKIDHLNAGFYFLKVSGKSINTGMPFIKK